MWKNFFRGIKNFYSAKILLRSARSVFWLICFLFRFNRNTETRCFCKEAKQPKPKCYVSDSAETSFGSIFSCFESKLVSLDTLGPMYLYNTKRGMKRSSAQKST